MNKTYQIFSRNDDTNSNPFRLIITFHDGIIHKAFEARQSEPNILYELSAEQGYEEGFRQIHLTPAEYNSVKKYYLITDKIQKVN